MNVQKVMWCIGELGLEHERVDAGLQYGKNTERWYLALNPNGTVPLLEDGPYALWESNTIVRYLCARHGAGGLYPQSLQARADAERWMDWQLALLARPMAIVFQNLIRAPEAERDMGAVATGIAETNRAFLVLDGNLEERPFAAGPRFTMGDIPVGAMAHRWLALPGIERPPLRHVRQWYERLTERPAYREHVMLPLS